MKNLAKRVLLRSGVLRAAAGMRRGSTAILMYHSVTENPARHDALLGGIGHSREVFRRQMELLAGSYLPLSLDQVNHFVRGDSELPSRSVVVTFDDGYTDNYEIAAPILNEAGVPATFYVTVECAEERKLPWPSRLRFAFHTTGKKSWADSSGKIWPLGSASEREKALLVSSDECCKLSGKTQANYVSSLEEELDARVPPETGSLMMDFDQMRMLAKQDHIVGSHTMTHPNMAYLAPEDAHREMTESRQRLEQHLNSLVVHFSYPCPALSPHWTEQTVTLSRQARYETAVTTDRGLVHKGDNLLRLKRVLPTKTVEGLHWNLECAFAGRMA